MRLVTRIVLIFNYLEVLPLVTDSEYTLTSPLSALEQSGGPLLGLTILWHPVPARIGEQFIGPATEGVLELSRFSPLFRHPGQDGTALGHRCIARAPLLIRRDAADGVDISAPESRMAVELNGSAISGAVHLPREQVDRGVVLGLGGLVLLCLHWMRTLPRENPVTGLLGVSSAAIAMRDLIRQVAHTNLPVLLLGETGTGKEVAAQAIHSASKRRDGPLVTVNMATLSETLAAADLFGAVKGAYTGLQSARAGFFAEADGGTLFLDEIGDTPATIQPMLLRVLETGEYRPLGARHNQVSSARLIAATDQDLMGHSFNQALLRRLEAFVIRVPALRERREDIGVLIRHFLQQWSALSGETVELPVAFISEFCNDDWPGNIRQLANVVRRAVMAVRAGATPSLSDFMSVLWAAQAPSARTTAASAVSSTLAPGDGAGAQPARADGRRLKLSELRPEEIVLAMENNAWRIRGAAQQLGISRPSLYKLLDAHPGIRRAEAIPHEEIRQALRECAGDIGRCASSLKTPSEALRRHLLALGLLA